MSLRLVSVFSNTIEPAILARLPDLITVADDNAIALERTYGDLSRSLTTAPWKWQSLRNQFAVGSTIGGFWFGPGGNKIIPGSNCIVVNTVAKWLYARRHPACLEAGYRYFIQLARVLGSDQFIVCHDGGGTVEEEVRRGVGIEQILQDLLVNGRPPVNTLSDLMVATEPEKWTQPLIDMFIHESDFEGRRDSDA